MAFVFIARRKTIEYISLTDPIDSAPAVNFL